MAYPQGPTSEGGTQTSGSRANAGPGNQDTTDGMDDAPTPYQNKQPAKPGALPAMGAMGSVGPQAVGSVTVMAGCPVCGYAISVDSYGSHVSAHRSNGPGEQRYTQITPTDPSKPF
jgi:hypothetical protein